MNKRVKKRKTEEEIKNSLILTTRVAKINIITIGSKTQRILIRTKIIKIKTIKTKTKLKIPSLRFQKWLRKKQNRLGQRKFNTLSQKNNILSLKISIKIPIVRFLIKIRKDIKLETSSQ